MTLRTRRPNRGIRTRLGRLVETEERQQALVTSLFLAAIGLVVLILIGAVAVAWYNENLRPLARVGATEVGPQRYRDYVRLELWRISRDENRLTQAQIDGDLTAEEAQARVQELNQRSESLPSTAVDELVDLIYQSELAAQEGVSVTDEEVEARLTEDVSAQEQRHVLAIVVEPQAADEAEGPTITERRAALERAQEALSELQAGADWATVAREFGTDSGSQNGGDLGLVSEIAIGDGAFGERLFELEQGATTEVILGEDGAYRIGRVTEVVPGAVDQSQRNDLFETVPEQSVREIVRYQVTSEKLRDKIVADALAQTPEQVHLAVIYVAGLSSGDPVEAEGEIHYSEIAYAPKDDIEAAPELDANDPAWAEAQAQADETFAELQAITDIEQRKERFAEIATDESDSPTAADGGNIDFVTRSIPPVPIGDALWGAEHADGDLIGPVRSDAGWYVLLFHEKRESVENRLQAVRDALAAPDADFAAVARELSEGPQAEDGGEAGWFTEQGLRETSSEAFADAVFALEEGAVSDALELGEGHYFAKALEREVRPLDPDQVPGVRASAFDEWYDPKRAAAVEAGTIVIPGTTDVPDDPEGGGDQP
jgi:parvulin-like peptidyl-prolyl isomerase